MIFKKGNKVKLFSNYLW